METRLSGRAASREGMRGLSQGHAAGPRPKMTQGQADGALALLVQLGGCGGTVWKKKWDVIKHSGECNPRCLVLRTGLKRPDNGGYGWSEGARWEGGARFTDIQKLWKSYEPGASSPLERTNVILKSFIRAIKHIVSS